MIKSSKSNALTGITGEYYVCAELGKRGILALLTPKNNPLFDIVAVSPDASRTVTIQVKTMSERNTQGWNIGKSICERKNISSLYTILVNLTESEIEYYIYEYDTLSERVEKVFSEYMLKPKRNGEPRKNTDIRWYDKKSFSEDDNSRKNNWDILGFNRK